MNKKLKSCAFVAAAYSICSICSIQANAVFSNSTVTQQEVFSSAYQTYFMYCERQKYPDGKFWNHGNKESYTDIPCEYEQDKDGTWHHDACNTIYFGVTVGYGFTKLPEEEQANYGSQCAGFARKLALDFTGGCRAYVRLRSGKNFKAQVGDQIRFRIWHSKTQFTDHSIFVTETNGTGLKFADCNWNDDCGIRWNVSGGIHNGALTIGDKGYSILWVDRPLMAGDVTGDGVVDYRDVDAIYRIWHGTYNYNGAKKKSVDQIADINNDYLVDRKDWELACKCTNGYIPNQRFMTFLTT